jgi:hypothetical protein
MMRIGGAVKGLLVASAALPSQIADSGVINARRLSEGLWFVPMSARWAARLDVDAGLSPGQPIEGFELLTAGVIAFAERLSSSCVVAYIERTYGLELVDCAVAWADGRIVAGPSGTSVTAETQASAANEVLDALGVAAADHASVLTALADG